MNRLEPYFWVAGVLQWLVAASNLYAARIFRYRQEMAKVSPFVREVFVVQNVYIMATVATFGVLCLRFAPDLAGRSPAGAIPERFARDLLGRADRHPALLLRPGRQAGPTGRRPGLPRDLRLPLRPLRRGGPGSLPLSRRRRR